MSTQYTTEPPPTATVVLHTTAGPLTISLFAAQTPLTCRNFLQHCLDGYYDNVIFHRVSPGFVIQTGDPTGTGEGGQTIYEDREFEKLDADWARLLRTDEGEPVAFGDEVHSRLKFNRRGLVGMAKGTGEKDGGYGSQFFITLGDCRAELDGRSTMFGRVEGDGIYNVVKIAEAELVEGTERPMYPEKILKVEVIGIPNQDAWQKMKKRDRIAVRTMTTVPASKDTGKKKPTKKKGGKALLSFGGDEGDEDGTPLVKPKKAKFNTALIDNVGVTEEAPQQARLNGYSVEKKYQESALPQKRKAEVVRSPSPKRRKPSFHDPTTQLPLRDPELPSRSPTPEPRQTPTHRRRSSASKHRDVLDSDERDADAPIRSPVTARRLSREEPPNLLSEIAALKASMRRGDANASTNQDPYASSLRKKSALESFIPSTSTRGRRRPRAGENNNQDDEKSLKMLAAFKAKLDGARPSDASTKSKSKTSINGRTNSTTQSLDGPKGTVRKVSEGPKEADPDEEGEEEEARLCDLHFISNCQSCFAHSTPPPDSLEGLDSSRPPRRRGDGNNNDDDNDTNGFLSHRLTFEKDRLGKDLTWKKKSEEDLVVIDPREREKELGIGGEQHDRRNKGKERERNGEDDWRNRDRDRDRDRDEERERERGKERNSNRHAYHRKEYKSGGGSRGG